MNINKLLYILTVALGITHQQNTVAEVILPVDSGTLISGTGTVDVNQAINRFKDGLKLNSNVDTNKISWDGVKLDGTDANPNTRIINSGKTVEIPVDRFKNVGAIFADPYTVSGDGFASVNPNTAGQFPAFSVNNTFAMFDPKDGQFEDRNIQQTFVLPNTNTPAGTRGFGAVFIDVEQQNSSIEFFGQDAAGNKVSLGKYSLQPGKNGEPQFLGLVTGLPIISEVELTVGSKALFSFDGQSVKAFGAEDLTKSIDLAVTDDFFFAVPETLQTSIAKVSQADCLFSWAEKSYPVLFSPPAQTQTSGPWTYRHYDNANINFYVGINSDDNYVYILDTKNGIPVPYNTVSYVSNIAKCN